jgi:hypothetical protein
MGHDHDHPHDHDHDHEHWEHPGRFEEREPARRRDFAERAFTVEDRRPRGQRQDFVVFSRLLSVPYENATSVRQGRACGMGDGDRARPASRSL